MATHHDDFNFRSAIDFAGETLVNPGLHLADPGPKADANVAARDEYEQHIGGPKLVRSQEGVHYSGSSPKVYFKAPSGRTWMLKPYFEGTNGAQHIAHYPLLGWSELASQGLYHAGGLGHLVQHAHVAMHSISPTERHPFVAIAFHPKFHSVADSFSGAHVQSGPYQEPAFDSPLATQELAGKPQRPTTMYNDAAKVAFMDFLTNHQDRHSDNLLWGWDGEPVPENLRLHVIDNATGFQYRGGHYTANGESHPVDHLAHYFMDSTGISSLGRRGMGPWDDEHVLHAADWWLENGPFIRQEFERHLEAIKDKTVRRHIAKNFHARAEALDHFSVAFQAAPKFDLYSPYSEQVRARKVAEAKVYQHDPIAPWHWPDALPFDAET